MISKIGSLIRAKEKNEIIDTVSGRSHVRKYFHFLSRQEEDGQTMADIAKQWDLSELEEVKDYTFMQYVGIAFGALVGTLFTFCVSRECLGCYNRRQARREMARTIGDQVRTAVDNMEMMPLTTRSNPTTQSESVSNTNTARRSVAPSSVNAYPFLPTAPTSFTDAANTV